MAQTIVISIFSTDCPSPMSRSWSRQYWNNWEDHSYSQWQPNSHSQAPPSLSPSFTPDLPAHWKETDVHYGENGLHGYPLFKTIQHTAWSRKRGLHGMDPVQVPLLALCRYQSQEFALRTTRSFSSNHLKLKSEGWKFQFKSNLRSNSAHGHFKG